MELIRTIREKSQTKREQDIQREAIYAITISDFDDSLFIAYRDTPLIPIEENATSKDILSQLNKLRQNYINVKIKELC